MDQEQPPKKIRRGAKSCTECRRRKIRCAWLSDDAQVCRRCEERGSQCVPQVFSSQPTRPNGTSSRERISHLERQVGSLIEVVNTIQQKHGEPLISHTFSGTSAPDGVASEEESEEPDEAEIQPPSYLATLFNNSVLSPGEQTSGTRPPKESFSNLVANKARSHLQALIPSKANVDTISSFSTTWLSLYQTLFPTHAVAHTEADIVSQYGDMKRSDVDPTSLGTWLVTVAITVQQIPADKLNTLSGFENPTRYARVVSDAVETNILAHDSLIGTMGGLDTALHFIRLQAGHANFKKIWLTLRRVIAIAELIGLPRTVSSLAATHKPHYLPNDPADDVGDNSIVSRKAKAETWISICTLDRILGMMCNLPTGTTRYPLPTVQVDPREKQQFLKNYLRSLANNANKLQELDDLQIAGGSDDEIYAEVLKVDRDLISLAATAPREWWEGNNSKELPFQLVPYWHYYVTLRTHLLLTLRRDEHHRFDYSRFTCMNACQHALLRFLKMRPTLPGGFFLGRMLDLQALTAAIVLLLSYHGSKADFGFQFQAQSIGEPSALIMQVVAVMEDSIQQKGSDFARSAAPTLRSLKSLLEDDGRFQAKDLTLKVPLLGKIHVKKKTDVQQGGLNSNINGSGSRTGTSSSSFDLRSPATSALIASESTRTTPPTNDWVINPFTWVIEDDRESIFRDSLLAEDFSQFESPLDYDNFNFTS